MRKWVATAATCVALPFSGCSVVAQQTAPNNATKRDVTACHTFGPRDQAAHKNKGSEQTTNQMRQNGATLLG
jgi:hypothetical protein